MRFSLRQLEVFLATAHFPFNVYKFKAPAAFVYLNQLCELEVKHAL